MSGYLMELAFGPVQSFIAAARRTADLWAGSRMLSEIARTAGQTLLAPECGCTLIYPDAGRIESVADTGEPVSNVSNVMLVQIPEGRDPEDIADRVRTAVENLVIEWGERVLEDKRMASQLRKDLFRAQLEDVLEYFVAWAPLGDSYPEAYRLLKQTFAARKNTRDFRPLPELEETLAGLPKSSLDGHRETVLVKKAKSGMNTPLMLRENEQLDAMGVLKRALPRLERKRLDDEARFTPLTRIALDPWLRRLERHAPARLQALRETYGRVVEAGFGTRVRGNQGAYAIFPYDGALLYTERREQALAEARAMGEDGRAAAEVLKVLHNQARELFREQGAPSPYAALLMADGDRMGRFVSSARNAAEHNDLTRAIAGFADEAIALCRQWQAHCVYAGGEDIMALVPLDAILGAPETDRRQGLPEALARAFDARIDRLLTESTLTVSPEDRTSLRVGVVIAHVTEPFGVVREWASDAESYAKGAAGTAGQGNALGIVLRVRAGHDRRVRLRFDDAAAFAAMADWIAAYTAAEGQTRALSARVGYDLVAIAQHLRDHRLPPELAWHEVERLFMRARESGGKNAIDDVLKKKLQTRIEALHHAGEDELGALERVGTELVVARWLSAATLNELGREECA